MTTSITGEHLENLTLDLERDVFLRDLIRELTGILEDVIGLDDAAGFISIVGQNMGHRINENYRRALKVKELDQTQVAATLIDLKKRIKGDFYVLEEGEDFLILGNRACPFGEKVLERQSLCMMTSNVFGVIAAQNLGYSKVTLDQTIAKGDPQCRIIIHFNDNYDAINGREYFKSN